MDSADDRLSIAQINLNHGVEDSSCFFFVCFGKQTDAWYINIGLLSKSWISGGRVMGLNTGEAQL